MILRKDRIAALLLLLPVLSAAVVVDVDGNGVQKVRESSKDVTASASKLDVGTKDAPVDGLDGKPHAGPFVVENSPKTTDSTKTSSRESLSDEITVDQKKISSELLQEKDIGVMDDPDRASPKKGTTGTEGGVSQRTKEHKALEEEKGEKLGKVPVSPDEERPLSNDEQERMGVDTADDSDDEDLASSTSERAKGAAGLAVCDPMSNSGFAPYMEAELMLHFSRNPQTFRTRRTAIAAPPSPSFQACPRMPTIPRSRPQ